MGCHPSGATIPTGRCLVPADRRFPWAPSWSLGARTPRSMTPGHWITMRDRKRYLYSKLYRKGGFLHVFCWCGFSVGGLQSSTYVILHAMLTYLMEGRCMISRLWSIIHIHITKTWISHYWFISCNIHQHIHPTSVQIPPTSGCSDWLDWNSHKEYTRLSYTL